MSDNIWVHVTNESQVVDVATWLVDQGTDVLHLIRKPQYMLKVCQNDACMRITGRYMHTRRSKLVDKDNVLSFQEFKDNITLASFPEYHGH